MGNTNNKNNVNNINNINNISENKIKSNTSQFVLTNLKITKTAEIEEAIRIYNEYMERKNWSKRTVRTYNENLEQFFRYIMVERGKKQIREITEEDVVKYQEYLYHYRTGKGERYSSRTQIQKLGTIRSFFKEMIRGGRILIDPASELEMPKEDKKLGYRALKEEEVEKIFKEVDERSLTGYRDRVILEMLYTTGIRVSELTRLKVEDVRIDEKILIIEEGKGGRERVVPLIEIMSKYLDEYIREVRPRIIGEGEDEGYLFVDDRGRMIKRRQEVTAMVHKYSKAAGIRDRIGTHNFRVTCATVLMRAGVEERYIQELLGHKDIKTTSGYMKVEIKGIKTEHNQYHPREHWGDEQVKNNNK